ncbi:HlyD family efflux transporter periplasmic adaptor subunit [Pseudoalteromonas luteoviolacea]|uniref:efflux RND transporter periplasmic adaptor subunit n=1 Tax=Pseudoalteromonas luteoviolacea TaxID=43657 RepID=UPI001B385A18|nr:HlyD family efflux transporter periplasmic adaptor subunit [Pseudoalteromonas luteoviolacea]MBQ4814038.1 HlyD family efflux transporter periplasmic adaptor subunit [Pseudoalteromonas luteoviolacea]
MDIKREKAKKWKNKKSLTAVGAVLLLSLLWILSEPPSAPKASYDELWVGTVSRGDLTSYVEGFGTLESKDQRLLTAEINATIEDILLKPGASVKAGDVILKMVNPDLNQEHKSQQAELKQEQAKLRQIKLNQKREVLSLEAELASLQAQHKMAVLKLQAESKLAEQGIVSQLDAERSKLDKEQLKIRLDIESRRLKQLKLVHIEAVKVHEEFIKQKQGELDSVARRLDNLTVRSAVDGVLQRLPVELGQSVIAGSQLALVGSVDQLNAMINIPQSQVSQVYNKQKARVRIGDQEVIGEVIRVEPEVNDGLVKVEIDLQGELPNTVRPEMNVEATIETGMVKNTAMIERPATAKANSMTEMFVINQDSQMAVKTKVQFGAESGSHIQIISGVEEMDQVILSDTSRWQKKQSIKLIR